MKRFLVLVLALVMLVSCFASCTNTTVDDNTETKGETKDTEANTDTANVTDGWAEIVANGKLVVGLDDTFVPMGYRDESNNLVGFDIDLAKAVGEYLNITVEFKSIDWEAKELELSSKRIDCIWNGMSATPARQESMSLTNKYLNNKIVIMALGDSDVAVAASSDLAAYKIGVQTDSAALEAMQADENYESFKDNVTEYDTYDEAILDMQAGRIQCIIVDEVLGQYKNNILENAFKTCEFDFGPDYYAIGCRKEDTVVADKLNEAIKALIENGKAAEISDKWFGADLVIFEDYAD